MDEHKVQGNWREIKQEVKSLWGDLTEDDLERSKGNLHKIADLVQERYGESMETIEEKMEKFLVKYSPHDAP